MSPPFQARTGTRVPVLRALLSILPGRFCRWVTAGVIALLSCAAPRTGMAHGSFHEEVARLDGLLREAPAEAGLWQQRGWLHLMHEDFDAALGDFEKAEALAPGRFPTGYLEARALAGAGRNEAALARLDAFLQAHPEHAGARTERARILRRSGRAVESLAELKRALADSSHPEPDLYLEVARAMREQSDPAGSLGILEQGMSRLGATPALVMEAVETELAMGRGEAALARVAAAQTAAPRPEPWMAWRARVLRRIGRIDDSRAAWRELAEHIRALPERERGSHAMSLLLEEAGCAEGTPAISIPARTAAINRPVP